MIVVLVSSAVGIEASDSKRSSPELSAFHVLDQEALSYYNSTTGLTLRLVLSPSSEVSGSSEYVLATLTNELSTRNLLRAPGHPPLGLRYYPCGPDAPPIGIFLFQGVFNRNNVSGAIPLALTAPGPVDCGPQAPLSYFAFLPNSDSVELYSVNGGPFMNTSALIEARVAGYWTGFDLPGIDSAVFHPFEPGAYTAVVIDAWGDLISLTFAVTSARTGFPCFQANGSQYGQACI